MEKQSITPQQIIAFGQHLKEEEHSSSTIEKYLYGLRQFAAWLGTKPLSKTHVADWKQSLMAAHYAPSTINGMLSALDQFLLFWGHPDCRVKHLKVQRRLFREPAQELNREEYNRLVAAANALGKKRLAVLMETICATGIRVSELKYITLEAVERGKAEISLKGKIRTILLPGDLRRKLKKYAKREKIRSGELFLTRNGNSLSRKQIWAEMKAVCLLAGVLPSKVFPHNLRHLFARTFYRACKDVAKLADLLGHSSIETTRIYLLSTGAEHVKALEQLHLIS